MNRFKTAGMIMLVATWAMTAVEKTPAQTFVYDWSTAAASAAGVPVDTDAAPADSNDNWISNTATTGDGTGDTVRNAGHPDAFFSGNYYQSLDTEPGNGDSIYDRLNDGNFSYSFPSSASTVDIALTLRASNALGGKYGLISSANSAALSFGSSSLGWQVRSPSGTITNVNGTGAGELDGTVRTYRATMVVDMTAAGTTKPVDLLVENLTDGGSELVYDDFLVNLNPMPDPATWDGLFLRVGGSASTASAVDDLTMGTSLVAIDAGVGVGESVGGGSGVTGGVDAVFDDVTTGGTLSADFSNPTLAEFTSEYDATDGFAQGNFLIYASGSNQQVWDVEFSGEFDGLAELMFAYDDSLLSPFYQANEQLLGIWHFGQYGAGGAREWRFLRDNIDTVNNIITISVDNFSPMAFGAQAVGQAAVPEPSSLALAILGLLSLGVWRRRQVR